MSSPSAPKLARNPPLGAPSARPTGSENCQLCGSSVTKAFRRWKLRSPGPSRTSTFAPANPPRVGSNVAPVTRVSVRAARGMDPLASPIPFSVLRFESVPDPRIDAPPGVIVTFDIVPAVALRSPTTVGAIAPTIPSFHFSFEPGSSCVGLTLLDARTGR